MQRACQEETGQILNWEAIKATLCQCHARQTVSAFRRWLLGEHHWLETGKEQRVKIGD